MAMAPWGVLAQGKIRTDAEEQKRSESGEEGRQLSGEWRRTEDERKVTTELEKIAKEIGAKNITSVAIAWIMQKAPYVFPIIGGRKVEHLQTNLEALEIALSDEQIKALDSIVPFDPGFPYSFFVSSIPGDLVHLNSLVGACTGQRFRVLHIL
jgi:aryl-alcohol dehydrogenase-like predicted oxidoreductase